MNIIRKALLLWYRSREKKTTSLQLRLFTFLSSFIFVLAIVFYFVMMICDIFDSKTRESYILMENELKHLANGASYDLEKLSLQGATFAEQLSSDINMWMQEKKINTYELETNPKIIEDLLSTQVHTLISALENNSCSGSFIILNATVNPEVKNAKNSRSGIFLKRTEPNAIKLINSKIYSLRDTESIARANGIEFMGQWQMKFDMSIADFYGCTIQTAQENSSLALSQLYYWSNRVILNGDSESCMLLCLPLISRDGTIYGICGFEVSSMFFKFQYSPDNSRYPHIFSTLSPISKNILDIDSGLIAGKSISTDPVIGKITAVWNNDSNLFTYHDINNNDYIGMHEQIKFYPTSSPYINDTWVISVIMPKEDLKADVSKNTMISYSIVIGLLFLSLLMAFFVSKLYISPVVKALDMIKYSNNGIIEKTKIAEINDLIEYLSAQDEQRKMLTAEKELSNRKVQISDLRENLNPNISSYNKFVCNINSLSPAEQAVFNLYIKGHTAKEASELLCLSINTIKTHNKHIYAKLNVTSRKELMVYVQMMANTTEKET